MSRARGSARLRHGDDGRGGQDPPDTDAGSQAAHGEPPRAERDRAKDHEEEGTHGRDDTDGLRSPLARAAVVVERLWTSPRAAGEVGG